MNIARRFTHYVSILAVLVAGFVYAWLNRSELVSLFTLQLSDVLIIAGILFLFFLSTGFTFYLLVSLLSVRLSLIEMIGLTFLSNFGNYLGPTRPGAAIKAIYLKGEKDLPYARFSAVLAANGFVLFFVSGMVGVLLLVALWAQSGILPGSLVAICLTLISGALLPLAFRFRQVSYRGRIWRHLNRATEGFEAIKSQREKLLAVCASVLLQYMITAWLMVFTYRTLGQPISLTAALIIGVFTSIANFLTITPNNLGIQEIVMAYLYTITGLDFSEGLLGASLMRAVHIILTFGLTPIFVHFMLKSANLSLAAILPGRKHQTDMVLLNHDDV